MADHLNLNARAWHRIQSAWSLPEAASGGYRMAVSRRLRSAAGAVQSLYVNAVGGSRLEDTIVILGFWRSGTTLLHEFFCVDDRFAYPTTYACLNPHNFVFTQHGAIAQGTKLVQRVQDRMTISLRSPQEDEFALLCLGARSPYEVLLAPRRFSETFALADPDGLPPADAAYWQNAFLNFLRGVSLTGGGKPLVLKSPTHSYRVKALRALLPNARFVVIVRNPYEVFESMVRVYARLTSKYGLEPRLTDEEVRPLILTERSRFETKLHTGLAGVPANRQALVRFEDLVQNPVAVLERLYRQLELPAFDDVRKKLNEEATRRSNYVQDAILPDARWGKRVSDEWAECFERYGYERNTIRA